MSDKKRRYSYPEVAHEIARQLIAQPDIGYRTLVNRVSESLGCSIATTTNALTPMRTQGLIASPGTTHWNKKYRMVPGAVLPQIKALSKVDEGDHVRQVTVSAGGWPTTKGPRFKSAMEQFVYEASRT